MNTLSETMVATRQKEMEQMQTLRRQVAVRDLEILSESRISYRGSELSMSKEAFKSLVKLIGMGQQFTKKFGETFSAEAKVQFINRMKNAMLNRSGEITLIVNPDTRQVIGFSQRPTSLISNESFLDMLNRVREDGNMEVVNWFNNTNDGSVSVNMANPNARFGISSLDEVFTAGVQMKNSPFGGIEVKPYVNRQWCTNGLVTSHAEESYQLLDLSNNNMESFFNHMNQLRRNKYVPGNFQNEVTRATETPASMQELNWAHRMINRYAGDKSDTWIPLRENESAYGRMGTDLSEFTTNQLKRAKSNQSIWSVVNGMTHLATHANDLLPQGMADGDRDYLITQAGNLMGREWDHRYEVKDPWSGSGLDQSAQIGSLLN